MFRWRLPKPPYFLLPAALICCGCDPVATQPVEYRPEEAGTVDHALCLLGFSGVPLREVRSGHHLVEVEINGRAVAFVLDTGANVSVVHEGYAEELGIERNGIAAVGAGATGAGQRATQARVESIRIGDVSIRQNRILLTELSQLAELMGRLSGERVYGLVGQDILSKHRAVIDVARPLLCLVEADVEPSPVPPERCRAREGGQVDQSGKGA